MSFQGKSVFTLSTAKDENSDPKNTTVTVVWDGLTEDQAKAALLSGQSPRVRLQGALRKNGIPAAVTVKAVELMTGKTHIPITVDSLTGQAETMTPAERAELIKRLTAIK